MVRLGLSRGSRPFGLSLTGPSLRVSYPRVMSSPDRPRPAAASSPRRRRRFITYPTYRLLGVFDDPAQERTIVAALEAAGIPGGDVTVLAGADAADRLAELGPRPNALSRLVRAFQFMSMDQLPDFLVYEAALREGRAVVAVRVPERTTMLRVRDVLAGHGVHFQNYYGRLSTEELTMWRGAEPDIPDSLRR
jgi:hypothetical protein